jgi:hypothetical protein
VYEREPERSAVMVLAIFLDPEQLLWDRGSRTAEVQVRGQNALVHQDRTELMDLEGHILVEEHRSLT